MDPRRVFRHWNKLRFPEIHIRTQEYYSTVRYILILVAGEVSVLTLKRKLLGLINFWGCKLKQNYIPSGPKATMCQPHQLDGALSKGSLIFWMPSPTAKAWFGTSDSWTSVASKSSLWPTAKTEEVNLPLGSSESWNWPQKETQSFHFKRSKKAFCTRKRNSNPHFQE